MMDKFLNKIITLEATEKLKGEIYNSFLPFFDNNTYYCSRIENDKIFFNAYGDGHILDYIYNIKSVTFKDNYSGHSFPWQTIRFKDGGFDKSDDKKTKCSYISTHLNLIEFRSNKIDNQTLYELNFKFNGDDNLYLIEIINKNNYIKWGEIIKYP